jgi:hypothetical protein
MNADCIGMMQSEKWRHCSKNNFSRYICTFQAKSLDYLAAASNAWEI